VGPFLSILKSEDAWRRFARVVLVHAVREAAELSYRETIDALRTAHPGHFTFVPFVSREDTDFVLRGRIPQAIRDSHLEVTAGIEIDAGRSQVMLCGNPAMVTDTLAVLEALVRVISLAGRLRGANPMPWCRQAYNPLRTLQFPALRRPSEGDIS